MRMTDYISWMGLRFNTWLMAVTDPGDAEDHDAEDHDAKNHDAEDDNAEDHDAEDHDAEDHDAEDEEDGLEDNDVFEDQKNHFCSNESKLEWLSNRKRGICVDKVKQDTMHCNIGDIPTHQSIFVRGLLSIA